MDSIVKIPIEQLYPHPDNPRKNLGDLSELADSIRAKGIMQNLTVIRGRRGTDEEIEQIVKLYDSLSDDSKIEREARVELRQQIENRWVVTDYTIIIGHRRHAAAKLAGLTELPCVITEMDALEQMQTMLIENMQRSDLTKFEEAQGFQMMLDLGSPVEEIAEKTGFSETTVRRRLKWMELDREKFKKATEERQISLGDLDRLSQIADLAARNECLDKIGTRDFDMAVQKAVKAQGIEENMPKVKAWLKSVKAKQIKDSERWGGKYNCIGSTIYIEKWGEDGNKPKDGIEKKPVFYYLGKKGDYGYGQLTLYHAHEKVKPEKRPPEEIAKEKAIQEAWKQMESVSELAYTLRKQFIENLSVAKKMEPEVLKGAVIADVYSAINYTSKDRDFMKETLGVDKSQYYTEMNEALLKKMDSLSGNELARLAYAGFGDSKTEFFCDGYRRNFPTHKQNQKLELLYRWLNSLGYQMSTEEIQLMNGEHEIYKAGEEYATV